MSEDTETTLGDVVRALLTLSDRLDGLATAQHETNARLDAAIGRIDETNLRLDKLTSRVDVMSGHLEDLTAEQRLGNAQTAVAMRRLVQHEERIRKLESKQTKPARRAARRV